MSEILFVNAPKRDFRQPRQGAGWDWWQKEEIKSRSQEKAETAVMLYNQKKSTIEIAGIIGVGRATVYRYLEEMGQERNLQIADNQ